MAMFGVSQLKLYHSYPSVLPLLWRFSSFSVAVDKNVSTLLHLKSVPSAIRGSRGKITFPRPSPSIFAYGKRPKPYV